MSVAHRRIYLDVPFPDKSAAKTLGARWDGVARAWFIPAGVDPDPFLHRWPRLAGDPALELSMNADGELIAAKIMGRLGGIAGGHKGGKARAAATSPERRREIALMGVQARANKKAARLARQYERSSQPEALSRAGSELRAGRGPGVRPAVQVCKRPEDDPAAWEGRAERLHALKGGDLEFWQGVVAEERKMNEFYGEKLAVNSGDPEEAIWDVIMTVPITSMRL
jgi:hypothetical protein